MAINIYETILSTMFLKVTRCHILELRVVSKYRVSMDMSSEYHGPHTPCAESSRSSNYPSHQSPQRFALCLERDIPLRGYPIGIEGDALSGTSLRTDAYIMHMYG